MNKTVSRRDFMKMTGTAGTGLVLSFYLPSGPHELFARSRAEQFSPNVWLKIDPNGKITITVARSEMGQGPRTYFPMIVAEELEADWQSIGYEQADAHPDKYGSQSTGGSYGVRSSWERLRKAGAAAREMLISAAARKWNVHRSECYANRSTIVHRPTGKSFSYGELVEEAALMPVPDNPPLKDPKDFKIVGTRVKQFDTRDRSTGKAMFSIDMKVEGMQYAILARCPVFGGNVARYDATKARGVPGVRSVIQIDRGVAVLADSTWAAMQGREALDITWDTRGDATSSTEKIRAMFAEYAKKEGVVEQREGDAEKAIAEAGTSIHATYELPYLHHSSIEPMNCLADVRTDSCEVWAPSQRPQSAQAIAAEITGLPKEKVTVHVTLLGGGFGRRLESDHVEEAVKISKAAGSPVKLTWTREDDMMHDFYRPASLHVVSGAVDKDGSILGWMYKMIGPSINGQRDPGRYKEGADRSTLSTALDMPYSIPNLIVSYVMANTPVPIGAWRSVYASQNAFVVESFIDELAHAATKDPLEFRLRLLDKSPRVKKVVELAAEKAGWTKPLPKGYGRGIATASSFGSHVAEVAEVSVDKGKIRVHRIVVAVDCGIAVAPNTLEGQVEGAVALALTALLKPQITIEKGRTAQSNFDECPLVTIDEMPKVEVWTVNSYEALGGIGEPPVPPVAPAVCNAVFAATGTRIRSLPVGSVA